MCNRYHEPHLVPKKCDIKMYIKMWKCNQCKSPGDPQEPLGKSIWDG